VKHLIILSHPNPQSFNSAIAAAVGAALREEDREFVVRDLYRQRFNPALSLEDLTSMNAGGCAEDVRIEREHVRSADTLVFIFPVICNNLPAMLKGYCDRVLSLGFGWRIENNRPTPLLAGKKAVIFCTTYSTDELCREFGLYESVTNALAVTMRRFCGIETLEHTFFTSVPLLGDDERTKMLDKAKAVMKRHAA
jgi:NAD(P)H dehydrogenase (quinone)